MLCALCQLVQGMLCQAYCIETCVNKWKFLLSSGIYCWNVPVNNQKFDRANVGCVVRLTSVAMLVGVKEKL